MFYYYTPGTTAEYLAKALRRRHEVKTFGPQALGKTHHDIPFANGFVHVDQLYGEISKSWKPDSFLMIDGPSPLYPKGVTALPIPTLYYAIDTHIAFPSHSALASLFDFVFVAQKQYVESLKKSSQNANIAWLPLACDPEIHASHQLPKLHDLCFLGGRQTFGRIRLLKRLSKRFNLHTGFVPYTEMTRVYAQSKIVFNKSIGNDLNMRVFEAMASGSMLLTDRLVQNGLEDLFSDRKELVVYDDDNIEKLAAYYLEHPDEREKIAEAGRRKVRELHTYAHRAEEIVRSAKTLKGGKRRKRQLFQEPMSLGKIWFYQSRIGQWIKNITPDATYQSVGIE